MNPHTHLKIAKIWANLLDKYGIDPIVSAIPIVGDSIGLILSLYIIFIAIQLEMPLSKLLRMLANVILDFLIGSIPILGFLADFFYKANIKNLQILEDYASGITYGEVVI